MVKFYKPGKVVIILNGKYAGRKGVIVKTNYESNKERKYPHCIVVGLSKGPRKATKRTLKKLEDTIKKLESKENSKDRLNRLKSFGVFIKIYNMSHLLVTRYSIKEDLGFEKGLKKLDDMDLKIKEVKQKINKLEHEKKEEGKKEVEELKKKLGEEKDNLKEVLNGLKASFGTEMYNRYMQGFVRTNNPAENEVVYNYSRKASVFEYLLRVLGKIILLSHWINNRDDYLDQYFYDIYFLILEFLIETVQGSSRENLNKVFVGEKKGKCLFEKFLSDINQILIDDSSNSPLNYVLRKDLMDFIMAFLEESATPSNGIVEISSVLLPSTILDSIIATMNKLYEDVTDEENNKYKSKNDENDSNPKKNIRRQKRKKRKKI